VVAVSREGGESVTITYPFRFESTQ
jgi:hypothetical protein